MSGDALGFVHRYIPPSADGELAGSTTLLLLHGTGGDEEDLLPLGRALLPGAGMLSPRGKVLEGGAPRFFRRLAEGVFDQEDLARRTTEPERYPRPIDAALLDNSIKIICKPGLFEHFRDALKIAFPLGDVHARLTLEKLVAPRNALYHANPVSVRQVEQIVCYSNDIIASIKHYYECKNVSEQFNAPTIIRISDNLGNVFHSSQLTDLGGVSGRAAIRGNGTIATLRAGETLSLEIEVDPTFPRSGYTIRWHVPNDAAASFVSEKLVLPLHGKHVSKMFQIQAMVVSNTIWHRYQTFDDSVAIAYRILPPP